ncbi:magnesium transporter MgtE N-terminal domain-containing protein [Wolbachia endosymbiont of Armadillidium arcangelii]|uniref:MgtE intracellular N domain protein n=1 Tax=Wolbachia endosymbiont of Armadillidium arcangelii TaxID=3158571 RepID=A0AAU7Q1L5_9RICK
MSGEKHIFKIVPGDQISDINGISIFEGVPRSFHGDRGYIEHSEYNLAKVNFEALDDESKFIELSLPLQMCQIKRTTVYNGKYTKEMLCLKEDGEKLNLCTIKQDKHVDDSDKDFARVELEEVPSPIKGKSYSLSIFDKESGECCIKSKIRTDSSFDFESAKKSLSDTNNFSILSDPAREEILAVIPEFKGGIMSYYPFTSVYDQTNNKIASIPGLSLAYFNGNLVDIKMLLLQGSFCIFVAPQECEYITLEGSGNDYQLYLSDSRGNPVEDENPQTPTFLVESIVLNNSILYNDYSNLKEIISSNIFTKFFIKDLTENQLKTFANALSNEQLQILVQNLTDNQLQALVDHLTNHQLQTLAQELNPEKLQIIVPILSGAQLGALVEDLRPEQVKEILPHLKVDQFKVLIKTLNNEQFTVLAKDLAEHHLTILSKELEGDQLKALVNSLQEEQLKDLVNKLDHEKLEAIAQDLTDSNKIQIIIKSLADNPDKLQAFARNMSNEQFKELLDNVGVEELKEIIHKLPYEKVTAVIGDLGNKDQSQAIIDSLKGKLDEQNEKLKEVYEKLEELLPPPVYSEALESLRSSPRISQDTNTEFIAVEEYAYHEI